MERKRHSLSQTQYIACGFLVLILIGTGLLMLPFASRSGESMRFIDALFTATSASCVTGLVVADTWSQWTLFGQTVIICLIQIGGLGGSASRKAVFGPITLDKTDADRLQEINDSGQRVYFHQVPEDGSAEFNSVMKGIHFD